MKIYQEVHFDLNNAPGLDLIGLAIAFFESSPKWKWCEEKTGLPEPANEGPAFSVLYNDYDQSVSPLVHVARKGKEESVFRVTNVTPRDISPIRISRDDYNRIAKRFGLDFRSFAKAHAPGICVYIPKADWSLKDIIKSKPARAAFERCLLYPCRGHERDDDPLHEFTCALFRRNVQFSLQHFERYLVEDRSLHSVEAAEFRTKVEIGLAVLRVCKRF